MICLLNKCRCKGKEAFWIDKINKEKVINNLFWKTFKLLITFMLFILPI